MNNPEIIVKNAPFKHFCMSIGAIPTSYKDSLDYYETLLYLIKYLEETVIPVVNNNGEAVSELQRLYIELKNFVDNYFANLDVQEEINNKLDDMAENGELDSLLVTYLEATKVNTKYIFPKFWENTRSGDIELIKHNDKNILIDCYRASNWADVKAMLDNNEATHIDYFILTHYHMDHDGNFENLITNGYIDNETQLFLPAELLTFGIETDIANAKALCEENNLTYNTPYEGQVVEIDDNFKFTFANCDVATCESIYTGGNKNLNSASTVVLFEDGLIKALYMADAQKRTLQYLYENNIFLNKVDLYKVEHHAINTDTYRQYISGVNPTYSVITDGIVDFSMNNESICATCSILKDMNSSIYNTCLQNDYLVFGSNGKTINVINGTSTNYAPIGDSQAVYVDASVLNTSIQDGTQSNPFKDLTTAIMHCGKNSKLGYVIYLSDGSYGYSQTDTAFTHAKNRISIRNMSNITIRGNSEHPENVNLNGMMLIDSNCKIYDVTIDNRYHESITCYGSNVALENCKITSLSSETSDKSGIILNDASSISLYNCYLDYCNSCFHVRDGSSITLRTITYGANNNHIFGNTYGHIEEVNFPTFENSSDKYSNMNNYSNYTKPIFIYNGQSSDSEYTDTDVTLPVNLTEFDSIVIQIVTKDDYRINCINLIKVANNDTFDLYDIYKAGANIITVGCRVKITNNKITYGNPFKITTNGTTGESTIDITNRNIRIRYIYGYKNNPINLT